MGERDELAARFEGERPRLRGVAYRMLGSPAEADDAVQEAWIRLDRSRSEEVENLRAWLTTVVARICLNVLRSRNARREEPLDTVHVPDPVVGPAPSSDPEEEALTADAVGLALLVVLDTLTPAERLAFVLHDVFAMPFAEIAPMVERTPEATRQLASRARRRVRGAAPAPDVGLAAQRQVVDAFFVAGRAGDLEGLLAVLDPEVTLRADFGGGRGRTVRGADAVAGQARMYGDPDRDVRPVTVNGAAGALVMAGGRPVSLMAFTVTAGRVAAIHVLGDGERLARLDLAALGLPDAG